MYIMEFKDYAAMSLVKSIISKALRELDEAGAVTTAEELCDIIQTIREVEK